MLKKRQPKLGKKVGLIKKNVIAKGKLLGDKIAAKRKLRFSDDGKGFQVAKKRRSSLSAACNHVKKIAKGINKLYIFF